MDPRNERYLKSLRASLRSKSSLKKKERLQTFFSLLTSPIKWGRNIPQKNLLKVSAKNLYSRARQLGKTI